MIETSLAKLRLFRISEFLGAAFIISVAAMIASIFRPERGERMPVLSTTGCTQRTERPG